MIDSVKWLNGWIQLLTSDPYRFSAVVVVISLLFWTVQQLYDRCVASCVVLARSLVVYVAVGYEWWNRKTILIVGPSRSGKTTLFCKVNYRRLLCARSTHDNIYS